MIHPTVRAEIGERSLTLLCQAADILRAGDLTDAVRDRWLGEFQEMIDIRDLTEAEVEKLRAYGVIE